MLHNASINPCSQTPSYKEGSEWDLLSIKNESYFQKRLKSFYSEEIYMFYNPYGHVLGLYTFLIYKSNICQGIAFLKHTWRKLKTTKEIKEKWKS